MTAPVFTQPSPPTPDRLQSTLVEAIKLGERLRPRSLQTKLGPSEVGMPCLQRLGRTWLGLPASNFGDKWAAMVGTGCHSVLGETFTRLNELLGKRWLIEHRVEVRVGLTGSVDLYDLVTGTVIDWKVLGVASMKKAKSGGPRPQYVTQAHLYGMGMERAGYPVTEVALAMLPRSGYLGGMHLWKAPYDPAVAQAGLDRLDALGALVAGLDVESYPDRWAMVPRSPGHECSFCDFYTPGRNDPAVGCPGDTEHDAAVDLVTRTLGGRHVNVG